MLVLVVDDQADNLLLATRQLRILGHSAVRAIDVASALAAVHEHPVEAALVDRRLGRESGLDVVTALRRPDVPFPPGATILVQSADWSREDAAAYRLAGADATLLRPVEPGELSALLARGARDVEGPGPADAGAGDVRALWCSLLDGRLDDIRRAVDAGDAAGLAAAAHALRSASLAVGCSATAAACATVEGLARSGALAGTELLATLEATARGERGDAASAA